MGISALIHKDKAEIKRVAWLHNKTLLPSSPIAIFGSSFMEKFYYSRLIKDSLIHCDYYQYDGKIVGFIAYTKNPSNFLRVGIRKNFFYLSILIIILFCQRPKRLTQILKVSQLERAIKKENKHEGAILSFGVLSEYRSRNFIYKTGLLISAELFQHTVQFFRKEAFSTIRLLVEPDNKETLLFYHHYGCKFQKIHPLGKALMKITCRI